MTSIIQLDAEASQHVLEQAVRTQAQVVLEALDWGPATINGFLVSGDAIALLMEITGRPAVAAHRLPNTRCDARLYAERRYAFASTITAVPRWGSSRCLALARPQTIGVFDRRRFLRACLAPSSRVRLEWTVDGVLQRQVAAMLNISPDGLACRVEGRTAAEVNPGDRIRARFRLPALPDELNVYAIVCSKTPASEGHTIMGLHFQPTPEAAEALAALKEALANPCGTGILPVAGDTGETPVPHATEACV